MQTLSLVSVFPFRKFRVIFCALFAFGVCGALSSEFEPGGKPEINFINPNAEIIIGAAINVRKSGSGLFGCGERRLDGVIAADALKWMVGELNRKIWSASSSNVSFGLCIMDSCSRSRVAASQLVEFLPELQAEEKLPPKLPFKFCLIDDIGLGKEADISASLEDINVPVVDTNINVDSPQILINAVLLFAQELRWDHLIVVHSGSRFSSFMLKHFGKLSKKFDSCIPWVINIEDVDENENEVQMAFKSGIPVLSLLASEEHSLFLKLFERLPKSEKKIPIMFSGHVSRQQLKMIPGNEVQIYSVIPYPEREVSFENYYSRNSIMSGIRTEDELNLAQRTKLVRKIKLIGEKLSEALKNAIMAMCHEKIERLCQDLLSADGRKSINDFLTKLDWTDTGQLYELVNYQYQLPEEHVHLHKIMAQNGYKNIEVFETNISFSNMNCNEKNDSRLECRCLEVKSIRSDSARNIDDWRRKKQRQPKHSTEKEKVSLRTSEIQQEDQLLRRPMVFALLNDPLTGTLACLTLIGGLLTLIIAQYFATFAALPNGGLTTGTSVIGYIILIGLFLLFSSNLTFLFTPFISTCALRRFLTSFSYAIIFSGMLIKVWSSHRQSTRDKVGIWKPFTLLSYSGGFSLFQLLPSGLWLILKPPATEYALEGWVCYPSGDLDSHLIISMVYPIVILLITLIVAVRTCSKTNNDEARWILISSSLVAIIFSCWGVAITTGVWRVHRTPSTNLAVGTILLFCLYIPKIKLYYELKKSLKAQRNSSQVPSELDKERSVFFPATQPFPVVLGYNVVAPSLPEDKIDPNYINQAYSTDENSETLSGLFDIDSSYSEVEQETRTFSTFLEGPQLNKLEQCDFEDPSQVLPSALYPIEMFNNEPVTITSDHCQPGTNEFTPPHRTTSQLYLCPRPSWVL